MTPVPVEVLLKDVRKARYWKWASGELVCWDSLSAESQHVFTFSDRGIYFDDIYAYIKENFERTDNGWYVR